MDIRYRIAPDSLGGHRFVVELAIDKPDAAGQSLSLPAWIPGSYLVRDFAKHIGTVTATNAGKPVRVVKQDKSRWHADPVSGGGLLVRYEVFAHDLSVRGAHLDSSHGFFNGTSVFLCVDGQENSAVEITIDAPVEHQGKSGWRVATTLQSAGAEEWGFGRYQAHDYDDLIDHPVEMGEFDIVPFTVASVPHYIVLSGRHFCDTARLAKDAAAICDQHVSLFGELPQMEKYLFLTRIEGNDYGGLEHRCSTALVCSRHQLPAVGDAMTDDYCRFLGLVSHEYFHLWNVKRIKPASFLPYDLSAEAYTRQLWIFEGITSYYDDLALVRSGVIDEKRYLQLIGTMLNMVNAGRGQDYQTLEESSFDAWVKFYKPDENTLNSVVSYYKKGALVALALDLTLRQRTSGKVTLDHVMRAMWENFGAKKIGVAEDGFEETVDHVSGLHLRSFFDIAVRSTEDLGLLALFQGVGIDSAASTPAPRLPAVQLGVVLSKGTTKISTIVRGGCAERASLAAGDEIIAIDRLRVSKKTLNRVLQAFEPGATVTVTVFRRDQLMEFSVCLEAREHIDVKLVPDVDAGAREASARQSWLAV